MKSSWRTLQVFTANADAYLNGHKGESKISYAIKRVRDQIAKYSEDLQARLTDIEIETCVADEKEVIQRDAAGQLQFTRAGIKERNARQRKLLDEEFEIEPHLLAAVPADLTPLQLEAFQGFIIPAGQNGNGGPPEGAA